MLAALSAAVLLYAHTWYVGKASTTSGDPWPATIAYWRFENGRPDEVVAGNMPILDYSGHGLNGMAYFGPQYKADVACNPIPLTGKRNDLSLAFNGKNQRIFVPDNPLFQITHSITLEAFVKVRYATDSERQIVFRGDDRNGFDPYLLSVNGMSFNFSVENEQGQRADVRAPIPAIGHWYYVAGILDGETGEMTLYINDRVAAQGTTTVRPFAHLDPRLKPGVGIGNTQSDNYKEYFDGMIDEVRISNAALRGDQLLSHLALAPDTTNSLHQ